MQSGTAFALTRAHLITKSDIYNIGRACGLSVSLRTSEMSTDGYDEQPTDPIYDKQVVAMRVEENDENVFFGFDQSDGEFVLGIQASFQKEMFSKFGSNVVSIGSAHNLMQHKDYLLITVVVITDQGKGFPAAWFIISKDSEPILTKCFTALRERVGDIRVGFFMSEDSDQYWNAWQAAFGDSGDETRRLVCIRSVQESWKTNRQSKVPSAYRKAVQKHLMDLSNAETEQKFQTSVATFFHDLRNWGCHDFLQYFRTQYCGHPLRPREWAIYGRRESTITTTMHVEAIHNELKQKYFGGVLNRGMDCLVSALLKLATSKMSDYRVDMVRGLPAGTHRMRETHKRHRDSLTLSKDDVIVGNDGFWSVPSDTKDAYYSVRIRCADCPCAVKCRWCTVCSDLYFCDCPDARTRKNACKHMHFIHGNFIPGNKDLMRPQQPIAEHRSSVTSATVNRSLSINGQVNQCQTDQRSPNRSVTTQSIDRSRPTMNGHSAVDGQSVHDRSISITKQAESDLLAFLVQQRSAANQLKEYCISSFKEWSEKVSTLDLDKDTWAAIKRKLKEIDSLVLPPSQRLGVSPASEIFKKLRRF